MAVRWNAETLWETLSPLLPGLSIEVLPQTTSTNTVLLDRARAGDAGHRADDDAGDDAGDSGLAQVRRSRESAAFRRRSADVAPCLLVAEHQTGGRGRMGRTWTSAAGASLTFSLSLPMDGLDWSGLSLAVGVALAEALAPSPGTTHGPDGPRIGLKWPNDLWLLDGPAHAPGEAVAPVAGRKLGGILIESVAVGGHRLAVVGVGLNVLPQPAEAAEGFTHGHACLQELHPGLGAPEALARVAQPLVQALLDFRDGGFARFHDRFAARDLLRGQPVTTTLADLPEGVAEGVAPNGALRVRTPDGGLHEVASGEVSVRLQGRAGSAPC